MLNKYLNTLFDVLFVSLSKLGLYSLWRAQLLCKLNTPHDICDCHDL